MILKGKTMTRSRSFLGLMALVLLLVLALPALGPDEAAFGAGEKGGEWKNVTLLYTTDVKGKIEPCG